MSLLKDWTAMVVKPPVYDANHMLLRCPQPGKEVVYLTVDDGPGEHLEQLTKLLGELGAKVTFFWNGANVPPRERPSSPTPAPGPGESEPELQAGMQAAFKAGNQPATHGSHHNHLRELSTKQEIEEHVLEGGKQKIEAAIPGAKVDTYRPPYGDPGGRLAKEFFQGKDGKGRELHVAKWDIDTEDWKSDGEKVPEILARLRQGWGAGGGGLAGHVLLMHEKKNVLAEMKAVVEAIKEVCPKCEFWTLGQCFDAEKKKEKPTAGDEEPKRGGANKSKEKKKEEEKEEDSKASKATAEFQFWLLFAVAAQISILRTYP